MESFENEMWIIPFKEFSRLRVKLEYVLRNCPVLTETVL